MICPYCKNHIQENAKACPFCGVSYINKTQQPFPTEQLNQQYQQETQQTQFQQQPTYQQNPNYQPNTQAPLYNPNYMYAQNMQFVQPQKKDYNPFYWVSAIMGLLGAIMTGISVIMPFATISAYFVSQSKTLLEIDKSSYIIIGEAVLLILFSMPGRKFKIGDSVGKIILSIIGLALMVYYYKSLNDNFADLDVSSYASLKMSVGFYFLLIGYLLTFISGCTIVPSVDESKKGG